MLNAAGYEVIPGSARRYRDPDTGETISRWEMQRILHEDCLDPRQAAKKNAQSIVPARGAVATKKHATLVAEYKHKVSKATGVKPSQVKVKGNSPEAVKFRKLAAEYRKVRKEKHLLYVALGKETNVKKQRVLLKKIKEFKKMDKVLAKLGIDAEEFVGYTKGGVDNG